MKRKSPISLPGSKPGFTLVELLVVIAMIAILASTILPALTKDRARAKTTQCLNNLEQFGMAMSLYSNDFNNLIPGDYYAQGIMFGTMLAPYIGGKAFDWGSSDLDVRLDAYYRGYNFFQCPSIMDTNNLKPLHYLNNSLDIARTKSMPTLAPETIFHKLSLIPRPTEVGYLTEINATWALGKSYVSFNIFSDATTTFRRDNTPNTVSGARMMHEKENRHTRQVNVTFFDSHAESRNLDTNSKGVPYKLFAPYSP